MSVGSYRICRPAGIPVRAHVSLVVFLPLMALYLGQDPSLNLGFFRTILILVGYFAGIVLHELGHSLVAMRYGCGVRQILLLPIGGVAQLSHFPEEPRAEVWIALAGPAVSLLLSGALGLAYVLLSAVGWMALAALCFILAVLNLALALFNLLPSFPMDGGRVFRALLTPRLGRLAATRLASRIGRAIAMLLGLLGLFSLNLVLMAVAFFVYHAAAAEYRMVRMQEAMKQSGGGALPGDAVVGPPPYARFRNWRTARPLERNRHGLWDDLYDSWR
jgi:Zn-dependent protease